jgi:hypothetical protein
VLYVGNDSNLEVLGLKDEDGNWITNAALSCTITDPNGNTVAVVTLTYRGAGVSVSVLGRYFPDGNYRGVLSGSNSPALVAGSVYKEVFAASNYGFQEVRYETAQTRLA